MANKQKNWGISGVVGLMGVAGLMGGLITALPAEAQTDAGTQLEQQRRAEPALRPAPLGAGVLQPTTPSPALPAGESDGVLTTVKAFTLQGNTVLTSEALQAVLKPWLDRPLRLSDLRGAATALNEHYRASGWLAEVSLPAQDITEGQVTLRIVEARRGRIVLQAASATADKRISPALTARLQAILESTLPEGQPINLFALERALLIADDTPGQHVNGSLQASETPGTTDVLIQTSPSGSKQIDLSADNSGSRSTGAVRLSAQLMLNGLLERGEQLSLSASKSQGSEYLRLGASVPVSLPYVSPALTHGWRVGVNASALRYRVLDSMNTTTGLPPQGTSRTLGADLQYPVLRNAVTNLLLTLGMEQKRLSNQDDNQTLNVLVVTSASRTNALTAGLSGTHYDRVAGGGVNSGSAVLTLGRINLEGSPAAFITSDAQTSNTQGSFQKLRWSVSRLQSLTNQVSADWSLWVAGSGQFASKNLDASEKFYLGGMNGVRAYPSAEGGGSTGQLFSVELRDQLTAQWQLAAFYDLGHVQQFQNNQRADGTAALSANNSVTLQGTGLSVAWRDSSGVQLKATWARRIGSNPLKTSTGTDTDGSLTKNRFWLNANMSF